jgi:hypothetical protein
MRMAISCKSSNDAVGYRQNLVAVGLLFWLPDGKSKANKLKLVFVTDAKRNGPRVTKGP